MFYKQLLIVVFMVMVSAVAQAGWIKSDNNLFIPGRLVISKAMKRYADVPFNIESILPKGYVKDGSQDYTIYLQQALASFNNIVFPPFPIMVNDNGLTIRSNTKITFMPGAKLLLKATSKDNYAILRIVNADNIELIDPVIVGDRYQHLGNSGEWGFGISILSSSNITVRGGSVNNCWGDGIYIGRKKTNPSCSNIHIVKTSVVNNRRDGFSIISVKGLILDSIYAGNSDGTLPMSGINFEPETSKDELQNIVLNNPRTEHNGMNGIQIGYSNLYGGTNTQSDIHIYNHVDISSKTAVKVSGFVSKRQGDEVIKGELSFVKPYWAKNALRPIQTDLMDHELKLSIISPTIINADGGKLNKDLTIRSLTQKTSINKEANYNLSF